MKQQRFTEFREAAKTYGDELGSLLIEVFHYLALFIIGASIVWAGIVAFGGMVAQGHASISDILLLFIYLELGAMVGIYFKTNVMPVRCLIFIAITALSRLLISDIQTHHQADIGILIISGSILLLAVSTLVIRRPE
ncbi:MAG: phosphate-starvation-inducible protein PsiE [Methylovulum sp.]